MSMQKSLISNLIFNTCHPGPTKDWEIIPNKIQPQHIFQFGWIFNLNLIWTLHKLKMYFSNSDGLLLVASYFYLLVCAVRQHKTSVYRHRNNGNNGNIDVMCCQRAACVVRKTHRVVKTREASGDGGRNCCRNGGDVANRDARRMMSNSSTGRMIMFKTMCQCSSQMCTWGNFSHNTRRIKF